jgi:hypothetical protein
VGNEGAVRAREESWHDLPFMAELTLPPLGVTFFRPENQA